MDQESLNVILPQHVTRYQTYKLTRNLVQCTIVQVKNPAWNYKITTLGDAVKSPGNS